jgi:phosphopantothenoylcysteine decarboxylase/phosphopantothenate--cysteine ligase
MAEPDEIVEQVCRGLAHADGSPWFGKKVVITAGGTREAIDPVRYIGNRSTGKMGYAIATAAFWRGANVELISSSSLSDPIGVNVTHVASAQEMANATWSAAKDADVAILAAAVADFRPTQSAPTKLRRVDGLPPIELQETSDILAGIVDMDPRPILVGFAAQTGSLDDAFRKVSTYGVDLLVANDVSSPGSGFGTDTNQVTVLYPDGSSEPWPLMTKSEVAGQLLDHIVDLI